MGDIINIGRAKRIRLLKDVRKNQTQPLAYVAQKYGMGEVLEALACGELIVGSDENGVDVVKIGKSGDSDDEEHRSVRRRDRGTS